MTINKIYILICFLFVQIPSRVFAQKDVLVNIATQISNSRDSAMHDQLINEYFKITDSATNHADFLVASLQGLSAIAKSNFAKNTFLNAFYHASEQARRRQIERPFILDFVKYADKIVFKEKPISAQLEYIIGLVYYSIQDYYRAEKKLQQVITIGFRAFPERNNGDFVLNAMNCCAYIELYRGNAQKAETLFNNALAAATERKNWPWVGITNGNLSTAIVNQKQYNRAIPLLLKDIEFSKKYQELGSALNAETLLAQVYLYLQNTAKAKQYIDSSLVHLNTLSKSYSYDWLNMQLSVYQVMGRYYHAVADYALASKYLFLASSINDSLQNFQQLEFTKPLINAIEVQKAEDEIHMLNADLAASEKQNAQFFAIIVLVSVLSMALLWMLWQKQKFTKALSESNAVIEQQKRALEQMNSNKDKLFSIIGHDLRGAATSINTLLEGLATGLFTYNEFMAVLPASIKTSNGLSATLDNLLAWSHSQFKGIEYRPEYLQINQLIQTVIELLSNQSTAKNIQITNNCTDQTVWADVNLLQVIVRNLLSNSIKFSNPNSQIELVAKVENNQFALSIRDWGVGMSAEKMNHVLQQQQYGSTYGTMGEKGVGLGLLIVKEFVEKNQGQFFIESIENEGTTFTFTIPLNHAGLLT